jgi:hypothetical protein
MIPLYPGQLLQPKTPVISHDGGMHPDLFFHMDTIFKRTGGPSGIPNNVNSAVIASGSSSLTAPQLQNHDYNFVTGTAGGGNGVMLNNLQPAQQQHVMNTTGGNVNVYPPPGGTINGGAINAPYVLPTTRTQYFIASAQVNGAAQLHTVVLGP